jgi:16S rRNA (cytosine1402-N4)-methyltransferase
MENQDPNKKPRRIRYKGTHPKTFKEKYKEHNPDKYADDVEKILKKGNTLAGTHRSICVNEILDFFQLKPGQKGLDATLGYGGHSVEMLKCIVPGGHLYATDVDPFELPKTTERLLGMGYGPEVFTPRKMNFSQIDQIIEESGPLDFILADLGVSSMQIDNPERGFSLKVDGPLDLRLNPRNGKPASVLLKKLSQPMLEEILVEHSDEPYADVISAAVVEALSKGIAIETTGQLRTIITETLDFLPKTEKIETIKKSCQRCFQALRIEVNNEFGVLEKFLDKLPEALKPVGKVVILSFHSGEDRRVKKSFQELLRAGIYSEIVADPIRPGAEEIFNNPRARSTKMRWAIKA